MHILNTEIQSWPTVGYTDKPTTVVAVLVEDASGQYAVYVGAGAFELQGDMNDQGRVAAAQWVAGHGAKLTLKKAAFFFSGLDESKYRR